MGRGTRTTGWLVAAAAVVWVVGQSGGGTTEPDSAPLRTTQSSSPSPDPSPDPADEPSPTVEPDAAPAQPSPSATARPRRGTALAALATLAVKGRAAQTGYSRERFGQAWLDADRNGCDTRNDMLDRDLEALVFRDGTGGCVVLSGRLDDPYTGTVIAFERGGADDVDIDHVIALGNAWVTGAARWDIRKRAAFANDPLELLAVDMHSNRQKGSGDAATWLPSNKAYRCAYAARQVAVKKKYGLWVTPPERDGLARVLRACPGYPLTRDRWRAPTRVDQNVTDPGAGTPSAPAPATEPRGLAGGGSVTYENCTAVREAGADTIRRGQPGYGKHLDRDGDGVGCE